MRFAYIKEIRDTVNYFRRLCYQRDANGKPIYFSYEELKDVLQQNSDGKYNVYITQETGSVYFDVDVGHMSFTVYKCEQTEGTHGFYINENATYFVYNSFDEIIDTIDVEL